MTYNHHFCYILSNPKWPGKTYAGYTVSPARRLRQHNGLIAGGSKYTSRYKPDWEFLAIIASPQFTKHIGLSFEWSLHRPTNRRVRPKNFNGIDGRVRSLPLVFRNEKFKDFDYAVYIRASHLEGTKTALRRFDNISVHELDLKDLTDFAKRVEQDRKNRLPSTPLHGGLSNNTSPSPQRHRHSSAPTRKTMSASKSSNASKSTKNTPSGSTITVDVATAVAVLVKGMATTGVTRDDMHRIVDQLFDAPETSDITSSVKKGEQLNKSGADELLRALEKLSLKVPATKTGLKALNTTQLQQLGECLTDKHFVDKRVDATGKKGVTKPDMIKAITAVLV